MNKRLVVWLIVLLSVLAIVSCSSRHVAEKPDTTRPTIISASPANGATAVAITTAVTITFSEAMNPSTVNNTSFLLVSVSSTTTTPVPGNVTYDASSNVATFTTTSVLMHGIQYIATITTGATDAAGNAVNPSYSWSFVTIPAPGALDTSFGTGGKVRVARSGNDIAYAAAIQQDGKIITAGTSTTTTGTMFFSIARFQPSGALDTTFGFTQNGWSDNVVGTARAVELQSDGKIVAAGDTGALSLSNSDFLIARYNTNGMLDTTFGLQSNGTGTVIKDMGYDHDVIRSLAIQADGKIIVAGDGINSGSLNYVSIIARFNADGTLDTSFADGGKRIMDTIGTTSQALVVKVQPDGMIIVGGKFRDGSGPASFYLARYDSNGAPDILFNAGMVTASPGAGPVLADIAILPNGKIIVSGTTNGSINADLFLMRYNADGTLDTTFGSTGTVITDDAIHGEETASGLAVQTDGKIVVSATFRSTGTLLTKDFALFRYEADGALDTTFGGNGDGIVTTDFGNAYDDVANDVQIQQDGKIVVVGMAWNGSNYDLGLARYWP